MDVARLSLLTLSLSQAQVGSKYVWNGTDWTWQQSRGLLPAVGEYRDSEGSGARGIEDGEDDQFDEEAIGLSEEEAAAADQVDRTGKEIRLDDESDESATMSNDHVQNQKSDGQEQVINTTCIHIFFFLYFYDLTNIHLL